ncbi:hypothetical protein DWB85_09165 [Seongchinamella sediminis]|uniref:Uncharacterized protein n=1 Tax=Seongchinamella sediminis TaxID=2283635 RepID=A0A3L7DY29_9GAMM|nr:hypothetical protein [Seongchinamella sediminis]RLQ22096.1 hypothetical protein DWB85_09165 [Seongchinamella sediminis]
MTTAEIKHNIDAALEREAQTGAFRQLLEQRLPELQQKLLLPAQSPLDALVAFVVSYARSVPGSINLVTAVSKRLQFFDYAAPFLHLAEDYFLQPPEILPGDGGLEALLDEAFLAHRLLEEVNDHHIRHLQRPLLPVDMTEANLIVHYLLGDELATRLEQLVQFTASHLLEREHVWEKVKALPGIDPAPGELICSSALVGTDQQIRLRLGSQER